MNEIFYEFNVENKSIFLFLNPIIPNIVYQIYSSIFIHTLDSSVFTGMKFFYQ